MALCCMLQLDVFFPHCSKHHTFINKLSVASFIIQVTPAITRIREIIRYRSLKKNEIAIDKVSLGGCTTEKG